VGTEVKLLLTCCPEQDVLIKAIQELCKESFITEDVSFGTWEFTIEQNEKTRWYYAFMNHEPLALRCAQWLHRKLSYPDDTIPTA
jgi:hypothetical protein